MNNSYQIKEEPEDFIVDEILNNGTFASNPTPINSNEEEGKIYWVCLKKRMWNTIDLTKEIAKRLRTNEKYINYAGIKDRVAVTYQCFSINSERENLIERINNIKDVEVTGFWKDKKWITSQDIIGNKFEIKVKGKIKKKKINEVVNYFGEQRFGNVRGNNHLIGMNLLKENYEEAVELYFGNGSEFVFEKEKEKYEEYKEIGAKEFIKRNNKLFKLTVHAFQSQLFNEEIEKRIEDKITYPLFGEYSCGINFMGFSDLEKEGSNFTAVQLIGEGTIMNEYKKELLEKYEITIEDFKKYGIKTKSNYRTMKVPVVDFNYEKNKNNEHNIKFMLQKGSYATEVVRQLF
jgi:tRNA pseudouridine13 synthase